MSPPKLPEIYAIRRVKLRHTMPGSLSLTSRLPYLPPLPMLPAGLTNAACKCGIVSVRQSCDLHSNKSSRLESYSALSFLEKEGLPASLYQFI